jgi:hypothetical protein
MLHCFVAMRLKAELPGVFFSLAAISEFGQNRSEAEEARQSISQSWFPSRRAHNPS